MKLEKDKIEGLVISLGVHLAILLLLFFLILRTEVPSELGGVLVNFGDVNEAAGTFKPGGGEYIPPQRPVTPPRPQVSKPEMITQDNEESVSLTEKQKKEKEKKQQEEIARQEVIRRQQEEERKIAEEKKKQQEINSRVAGAFSGAGLGDDEGAGTGTGGGSGQGTGQSGSGNQGSPFGNAEHGANDGIGGYGSFALDGRFSRSGGLPRPAYTIQVEGKIVVSITVDPKGNVIGAAIGKGTNIDNASMRNAAIEAARRATFNSITGTNNQTGTITYKYSLKP